MHSVHHDFEQSIRLKQVPGSHLGRHELPQMRVELDDDFEGHKFLDHDLASVLDKHVVHVFGRSEDQACMLTVKRGCEATLKKTTASRNRQVLRDRVAENGVEVVSVADQFDSGVDSLCVLFAALEMTSVAMKDFNLTVCSFVAHDALLPTGTVHRHAMVVIVDVDDDCSGH
jgi:hypothetical protein